MSYLVLARKYRSQNFDQVVQQEHVTRTLTNAIKSDRVAHAILFSGPRGTGKTTIARILAKSMNCKEGPTPVPCNVCSSCKEITSGSAVDVFEIDGASNNGVDQVRELRGNVKYKPAHSPYKIYIIDEVHMLSIAAFNALLKTLEEPPPHIMFMFATTEPRKIPITILSRCQRHDLRRITLEGIAKHMASICENEGIKIDYDSLCLVAREAGGSMRDALSLLDQLIVTSNGIVDAAQVPDLLGTIDRKYMIGLFRYVIENDVPAIFNMLDEIYSRGHDMKQFYADLIEHFRNLLVIKMGSRVSQLVDLPEQEVEILAGQVRTVSSSWLTQIFDMLSKEESGVRFAAEPKLAIEIIMLRLLQLKPTLPIETLIEKLNDLKHDLGDEDGSVVYETRATFKPVNEKKAIEAPPAISDPTASMPVRPMQQVTPGETQDVMAGETGEALLKNPELAWERLFNTIIKKSQPLGAVLTKCSLKHIDEKELILDFSGNDYSLGMLKRKKNMDIIKKICEQLFGRILIVTISAKDVKKNDKKNIRETINRMKENALNHPMVAEAVDVFQGKIVDVKILQEDL
ncbi:MAG: DNA polymerase III subunit gamma/tau [Desulfobacterales bacterium]|nr:DNA polymerase III subunit gamma/tau [Desulfobacterales bacterium]